MIEQTKELEQKLKNVAKKIKDCECKTIHKGKDKILQVWEDEGEIMFSFCLGGVIIRIPQKYWAKVKQELGEISKTK